MSAKAATSTGMFTLVLTAVLALGGIVALMWATDWITLEGEHTIYTVSCEQGVWVDLRCSGRLQPGDRYRFRASRSRNEVVFWIAGSNAPSGKHIDCKVRDRDNWICKENAGEKASIVNALVKGRPMPTAAAGSVPFRAVAKWKWLALRVGVPGFKVADYGSGSSSQSPRSNDGTEPEKQLADHSKAG